jgi:osmotically-inducible protein OsmY
MSKTTDIRQAVEAELKFDPLVDDADIHVMNMNGDVALNGTVPSYPQYLEAAAATQRVNGVKNVSNHLEVVLPDADFRDDAMLTTAANNALMQNITVPGTVEATALDGNLTLTGTVSYGVERAAAEGAVAGLTGVRNAGTTSRSATTPTRSTSTCTSRRRCAVPRWFPTTATSRRPPTAALSR